MTIEFRRGTIDDSYTVFQVFEATLSDWKLFMSDAPLGKYENYVMTGPGIFI